MSRFRASRAQNLHDFPEGVLTPIERGGFPLEGPSSAPASPLQHLGDSGPELIDGHGRRPARGQGEPDATVVLRGEEGHPRVVTVCEPGGEGAEEASTLVPEVSGDQGLVGIHEAGEDRVDQLLLQGPDPFLGLLQLRQLQLRCRNQLFVSYPEEGAECPGPGFVDAQALPEPPSGHPVEPRPSPHVLGPEELDGAQLGGRGDVGATAGREVQPVDLDESHLPLVMVRQPSGTDVRACVVLASGDPEDANRVGPTKWPRRRGPRARPGRRRRGVARPARCRWSALRGGRRWWTVRGGRGPGP